MKPKRLLASLAIVLVAAGAFATAEARPNFFGVRGGGDRDRGYQQDRRAESRREDVRREWRDSGEDQRRQRLSPDARRQLRRDVFDAGRDLYRDEPPRRRGRW